jgi:hypothetical protein
VKRAGKDDVVAIEFVHTDLDPMDGEEAEACKARYLQRLNGGSVAPMPSTIVDNGNGLNCLWRLAVPLPLPTDPQQRAQLIADVEERNRTLVLVLGGTAETRNIDRILRLPGTTNFPNAAKRQRGRTICCTSRSATSSVTKSGSATFRRAHINSSSRIASSVSRPYLLAELKILRSQRFCSLACPSGDFFYSVSVPRVVSMRACVLALRVSLSPVSS